MPVAISIRSRALGLNVADLFDEERGRGYSIPPTTAQPRNRPAPASRWRSTQPAKRLPLEFLRGWPLRNHLEGSPAVRIPYLGPGGELLAVRFRIALEGDRFRWKAGSKPQLYGLNRLARRARPGTSSWSRASPMSTRSGTTASRPWAPGCHNWREDRDAPHLDGIGTIYVVIEPDRGGEAVRQWVSQSIIRHRALLVTLPTKDASALHLESPADFKERWQCACLGAVPWTAHEQKESAEERSEAWNQCADLAQSASILDALDRELTRLGVVGERRGAKLIYLAVTSRLLDRPVSVCVKGPSSGGKSYLTESVLKPIPRDGLLRPHGDERQGAGLFERAPEAPAPRHLRGRRHGRASSRPT